VHAPPPERGPLLLAIDDLKAQKEAVDAQVRQLPAWGREFHGNRPYGLEELTAAPGTVHPACAPPTARRRSGRSPRRSAGSRTGPAATQPVSPLTAKTHVNRAMTKLAARDRAKLVVIAYQCGLVSPAAEPERPHACR